MTCITCFALRSMPRSIGMHTGIEQRQPRRGDECLRWIPQTIARQSTLAQAGENDEFSGNDVEGDCLASISRFARELA